MNYTDCTSFYRIFWAEFVEQYLPNNPSKLFSPPIVNRYSESFLPIALGKKNIRIYLHCKKNLNRVTVQLCFVEDANKIQFDKIINYKAKAEVFIGCHLIWKRAEGRKSSYIELHHECPLDNPNVLYEIFAWYKEYTEKFVEFFLPIIKDF